MTVYEETAKPAGKGSGTAPVCMFSEIADEWFTAAGTWLKKSSISKYRNILANHLIPEFGNRPVNAISRFDVKNFVTRLTKPEEEGGRGFAPKTAAGILSLLKLVMDYARFEKKIEVIDLAGITVRQPLKILRVFSVQEQNRLTVYLMSNPDYVKIGILLCLYTGIRVGELCALKWGNIDFLEECLMVTYTMQRIQEPDGCGHRTRILIDCPKTSCSLRRIPIPAELFSVLSCMRQSDDCYILTGRNDAFMEPRLIQRHFDRILRACEIEHATVHTCRHSMATRCVELGVDIKSLSEILGHSNVAITMNRYVHPSMELKKRSINKLCGMLTEAKHEIRQN